MPLHPLVIPNPRETVGSGRDRRPNRQSIHPSARLERSITKFLSPACCYRRNQRDGARWELLSPDRSCFSLVCVCVFVHAWVFPWAWESVCAWELVRVNVKQMLTKVTYSVRQWIASLHVPTLSSLPNRGNKILLTKHWTLKGAFISLHYLFT